MVCSLAVHTNETPRAKVTAPSDRRLGNGHDVAGGQVVAGSSLVYPIRHALDILLVVTKRLIDIDDDLLKEVRSLTGASTMKEAVNGALQHVVDFDLRLRHVRRLLTLEGTDLADEQLMRDAWR